jgi:NADH-quinone oxidoreductase subunit N
MFFFAFIPEIFLTISILFQLLTMIFLINNLKRNFPILIKETAYQVFLILLISFILVFINKIEMISFATILTNNIGFNYLKLIILSLSSFLAISLIPALNLQKLNFYEFFTFFLLSVLSIMLIVNTQNLIFFYLSVELQTLCFYILAIFNRKSAFSTEAGVKYFLLSSFISAFLLLGLSTFYAFLGTLSLYDIYSFLIIGFLDSEIILVLSCASILIIVVLLFKLACAPFHFWAADVYEAAPISSTIVFSIVPKIGLTIFLLKWIFCIRSIFLIENIVEIFLFLGVFSCLVGTIFSLYQKRVKGLIIFSSISQIGFIVATSALCSYTSYTYLLIFFIIYLITSFLIWTHTIFFYNFQQQISTFYTDTPRTLSIAAFSGFWSKNIIWSWSMLIIFFSIGGIPPFTGFLGKALVVLALIKTGHLVYSSLFMIISSVSVFYYIRILKTLFFEKHIQKKNNDESFQIVFNNKNFQQLYFISTLFLIFLFILLYSSTDLNLICEIISYNILY